MKHEQHLVELLRPLGTYDLNYGTINRGELSAYGEGLDGVFGALEEVVREMSPVTSRGAGMEQILELLPFRPASQSTEELGRAVAALLRIGGDSFTAEAINATLSGCGINVLAAEGEAPGYVEISFPDVKGVPPSFETLRGIIEEILPCHLEITYLFWYNTWAVLKELLSTWGGAEATGASWQKLSVWK